MRLRLEWWRWGAPLRGACARNRTFVWMGVVLIGFCARDDLSGVTSLVRALGLRALCYDLPDAMQTLESPVYGESGVQLGVWTLDLLWRPVGILLALATTVPQLVWASFGSWLRTIRPGIVPSEAVVAIALRNTLPQFLADTSPAPDLAKFIQQRLDLSNTQAHRLAA